MYVSDILDEAKNILGRCDNATVFRRLTDAVRLANTQGKFDWNIAQMDICVCDGCVTLPADVATILGVNTGGFPTLLRDQWYQYHINGAGSTDCNGSWGYTDELGQVCTYRDPSAPVKLVAVVENAQDTNTTLRVFGWDGDGKRIYSPGPDDTLEDGFLVPCIYGFPAVNPDVPNILRIDRIQKAVTNGFVKLLAVDATTLETHTTIGYYQPWETSPNYRRIRVPDRSWLRIKYRKKDMEVRASTDWINIENREAILLLAKAVKLRLDNQLEQARLTEAEGMRLLSNDADALRPPAVNAPQIIISDSAQGFYDTLFY